MRRVFSSIVISSALGFAAFASSSALAANITYKYDALGRLIHVEYSNGVTVDYVYDDAGNRKQVVTSNVPAPPSGIRWGEFKWGEAKW